MCIITDVATALAELTGDAVVRKTLAMLINALAASAPITEAVAVDKTAITNARVDMTNGMGETEAGTTIAAGGLAAAPATNHVLANLRAVEVLVAAGTAVGSLN